MLLISQNYNIVSVCVLLKHTAENISFKIKVYFLVGFIQIMTSSPQIWNIDLWR